MSCSGYNEPPQQLNLAHQFLDDSFLELTSSDSFTKLPLISSNHKSTIVDISTPRAVDYFSHKLTPEQYFKCWRSIANNKFMKPYELSNIYNMRSFQANNKVEDLMLFLPCTSSVRLENACWRAWKKNKDNLPEMNPSEINWHKENDITVLYGPLIEEEYNVDATLATIMPSPTQFKGYDESSHTVDDPMDEDIIDDDYLLSRTVSSDSGDTSLFSTTTAKSILVNTQKRRRLSSIRKEKRVSFSNEVEGRNIAGDSILDCKYLMCY